MLVGVGHTASYDTDLADRAAATADKWRIPRPDYSVRRDGGGDWVVQEFEIGLRGLWTRLGFQARGHTPAAEKSEYRWRTGNLLSSPYLKTGCKSGLEGVGAQFRVAPPQHFLYFFSESCR